jgi:hypothetical protein
MSEGRFVITTTLEGYVNALKPSGKFNNCCFSFSIGKEDLKKFDVAYENAIAWGRAKMAGKRFTEELPKWDEAGYVKYSYGGEQGNPMFPWIDTDGVPIDLDTPIWKGTVVKLAIDLKPYVYGTKAGCSLKVRGAQVLKLVGSGGSDSGELDASDLAALFGTSDGFKAGSPSFEPDPQPDEDEDSDIPF